MRGVGIIAGAGIGVPGLAAVNPRTTIILAVFAADVGARASAFADDRAVYASRADAGRDRSRC